MDPCGAVCDWGRVPYSTLVKPFRDSDETAMIHWRPAAKGARVLPFFSLFMNREWDRDKWELRSKGEVVGEPRRANHRLAIPGLLGEHPCGEPEWYAQGMPYDPLAPVCPRDRNGLPECCTPPPQIFGALISGKSGVSYTSPSRGGLVIGGSTGDVLIVTDTTSGGLVIGGSAGDELTYTDTTSGGTETGGSAGDELTYTDTTSGGTEVGGSAGDEYTPPPDASGGTEVGGAVYEEYTASDATAGGLTVGGQVTEQFTGNDETAGGLTVGGASGDDYYNPTPMLLSKVVQPDGVTLILIWDQPVSAGVGDITIGGTQSTTATFTSGSGTTTTTWTIATTIFSGSTVTGTWAAGIVVADISGWDNEAGTGVTIANNSTQSGVPVPGNSCATAGVMTVGVSVPLTCPGMSTVWLKCPQPASGAFHVTYTLAGFTTILTMFQATDCSTLGIGTGAFGSGCTNFTVVSGKTMFFSFNVAGPTSQSATIIVDTGTC